MHIDCKEILDLRQPYSNPSFTSLLSLFFSLSLLFISSSLSICAFRMRRHGPRILCRLLTLLSFRRDKNKAAQHDMDDNWRHLSPVFPPLPVQAEDEEDEDFEVSIKYGRRVYCYQFWVQAYLIMHVHALLKLVLAFPPRKKGTKCLLVSLSQFDLFPQFSHITLVDRARHQLYTIPEEESLEHSHHQYHHHNSINSTSTNNIPSSPMSSSSRASSLSICTSGSSSSSSLLVYRSPVAWFKDATPDELYDGQFVGDEFYCKQKLATMIQAATAYEKEDDYGDAELFFDSDDILRVICITRKHRQTECWRFRG